MYWWCGLCAAGPGEVRQAALTKLRKIGGLPQDKNLHPLCLLPALLQVFLFDLRHHAVAQPPSEADSEDGQDDQQGVLRQLVW
jgi:hypothetical protein